MVHESVLFMVHGCAPPFLYLSKIFRVHVCAPLVEADLVFAVEAFGQPGEDAERLEFLF